MLTSTDAQHFFETDATQEKRGRRAAKSGNKYGNPVALKSKVLAVLADPSSAEHVFVAESAGTVRRVNVHNGEAKEVYRGPTAPVTCLTLGGPGNRTLFAGCWDKKVYSWDVATRRPGTQYVGHSDFVKAVVCGTLGGQAVLVSGGADKKIIVWDVAAGQRLHTLQDTSGGAAMMAVQDLAVDPVETTADELCLVSASSDPRLRRWRVRLSGWEQESELVVADALAAAQPTPKTLLAHETTVYKIRFDMTDADGDCDLWTASADGTAKCLSRQRGLASSGSAADVLTHGDHVRAIAVAEAWVVTAGRDEDVQFWDRATGQRRATLTGHYNEVTDLAVLADGRRVCSVSLDGTVRTWPLDGAGMDALAEEQTADRAGKAEEEDEAAAAVAAESLLTADEEAELAALMED